uniref:ER membrane protein complex subunit 8 n=1 Tax=Bubo bubo TaxID=30461 RepID=A0A8C0FUP0_BUBBB
QAVFEMTVHQTLCMIAHINIYINTYIFKEAVGKDTVMLQLLFYLQDRHEISLFCGIDSWCKENSYVIAGYYQANERVKDASPNQVAEKVASRIAEGFNDTALIMVDNSKFTMECVEPAIHVYELHENKWRCKDPHVDFCEDWTEAQRIAASLLDSKSYETLVDFDNHLDDIRNDWTNPEINKAVLHLC